MLYNSTSQVDGSRDGLENVAERLGDLDLLGVITLLLTQRELLPTAVGHDDPFSVWRLTKRSTTACSAGLRCLDRVKGIVIKDAIRLMLRSDFSLLSILHLKVI